MEVYFQSVKDLKALTVFHNKGGKLFDGLEVLVERNARTKLIPAILKSWQIGEVLNDLTGYGKYSKSSVIVEFDGKEQSWPFSMVYLKPETI